MSKTPMYDLIVEHEASLDEAIRKSLHYPAHKSGIKLIGFTGSMGSGKSTAIGILKDIQKNLVVNVKFAQPLYDMQEMIYRRISQVHERPSTFIKDRKLLQWLGTDWGRDTISETLWVDLWEAEVTLLHSEYYAGLFVCDDVRFTNEAAKVRSLGGYVIKLECDKTDTRIDTRSGITAHKSEAGLPSEYIDFVIKNNGTIKELEDSIRNVYERIYGQNK